MGDLSHIDFSFIDLLDLILAGAVLYLLYRLLKGTIGFTIFIGILLIYLSWWIVGVLEMKLLSNMLGQFVNIGLLLVIVIFQPEIRKFLLLLGETTLRGRGNILDFLRRKESGKISSDLSQMIDEVVESFRGFQEDRIGALLVVARSKTDEDCMDSGVAIDAVVSSELLTSIFKGGSDLHDGAVIIQRGRIDRAGVVLPVTSKNGLSSKYGLRHRAAIGISERADVLVFVVSEENSELSVAQKGSIRRVTIEEAKGLLAQYYKHEDHRD